MISRPRWRVKVGVMLAAATLAVTAFGAVTAAPASAWAWNLGTARLTWAPITSGSFCTGKPIVLKAGWYRWRLHVVHPSEPHNAQIYWEYWYFRAGKYRWQDCIEAASTFDHVHCSWLDELATPGGPARFCHGFPGTPGGYGNGTYEYGSGLVWSHA